jgi:hypothetical protein
VLWYTVCGGGSVVEVKRIRKAEIVDTFGLKKVVHYRGIHFEGA